MPLLRSLNLKLFVSALQSCSEGNWVFSVFNDTKGLSLNIDANLTKENKHDKRLNAVDENVDDIFYFT